jgi:hypothetical protein
MGQGRKWRDFVRGEKWVYVVIYLKDTYIVQGE